MWSGFSSALFGETPSEQVHQTVVADLPKSGRGDLCGVPSVTEWCDEIPEDSSYVETHKRATDAHVAEFEAMLAKHFANAPKQAGSASGLGVSAVGIRTESEVPPRQAVQSHSDVQSREEGDEEQLPSHWDSFRSTSKMCVEDNVHEATTMTTDEEPFPSSQRSPSCSSAASASHVAIKMQEVEPPEPTRRVDEHRLPQESEDPVSPNLRRFRAAVHLTSTVGTMLLDVRSRHTEQLYDQDWLNPGNENTCKKHREQLYDQDRVNPSIENTTKKESLNPENHTATQSPIEKWQQHRNFQLSSVAGGLLHQVRSKETETLYDSNWSDLLSHTDSEENYMPQDSDHDTNDPFECEPDDATPSLAGSMTRPDIKASGDAQGLSSRQTENFVDKSNKVRTRAEATSVKGAVLGHVQSHYTEHLYESSLGVTVVEAKDGYRSKVAHSRACPL